MRFARNPPWLVEIFDSALAGTEAARRSMFGSACAFVGGNLACGLFAASLFVRLPEAERAALLAQPGAAPFDPMGGRPMREYVLVPPALLEDERALKGWIDRALEYAARLPPKKKAAAGRPAAKKGAAKQAPRSRARRR